MKASKDGFQIDAVDEHPAVKQHEARHRELADALDLARQAVARAEIAHAEAQSLYRRHSERLMRGEGSLPQWEDAKAAVLRTEQERDAALTRLNDLRRSCDEHNALRPGVVATATTERRQEARDHIARISAEMLEVLRRLSALNDELTIACRAGGYTARGPKTLDSRVLHEFKKRLSQAPARAGEPVPSVVIPEELRVRRQPRAGLHRDMMLPVVPITG